jgi:GTP-binding protein Era
MADETSSPDSTAAPIRRAGTVALVGRSNVGKSTLMNAALALPLAIVSHKPQTTRDRLLGIVRHGGAEIGLLDTPGLHKAQTRLGREMNRTARAASREADVVVFVAAVPRPGPKGALKPHPADLELLSEIAPEVPVVLAINKIDLVKDKRLLLPLIAAYAEAHAFAAVVPLSALREDGITLVLDEVAKLLPEGVGQHGEDDLTDRPLRWFAAEYVREAILEATSEEVPHATAVTVDRFDEPVAGQRVVEIDATIHVERTGQKRIMIGEGGQLLKRVGITARKRIEELLDRQVHLTLWVRVTKDWRQRPDQLADLGLLADGGSEGTARRPRGKS